jgi:sugar phosphate isomerase/epimerase
VATDDFFDRYGVSTWLYANRPLDDSLRGIAGVGFRWVEIWADGFHIDPRLGVDLSEVARLVDSLGLRVHSVHTPFTGLNIGHPRLGDPALWRQLIGQSIRDAGRLGAEVAVVHPSGHREPVAPEDQPSSVEAIRSLVADLVEVADASGVRVALENMLHGGIWKVGKSLAELADLFPDPRVGFCLDTGHAAVNGVDNASEIRAAGSRLVSIHAANNDGASDLHYPPTQGVVSWPAVEAALREIRYPGRLMLEVAGRGDSDGMIVRLAGLADEVSGA